MRALSTDLFKQATDVLFAELCAIGQEIEDQYAEAVAEKDHKAKLKVKCDIILMPIANGKVGGEVRINLSRGAIKTESSFGAVQQELPV